MKSTRVGLRSHVIRATKWTTISFVALTSAQFLNYIIIARTLDPSALGEVAIVTLVNGLAEIFLGMGLSQAVIQRTRVNSRELASLFWLNLLFAIGMASIVFFLSVPIADFFNSPESILLIQVAGLIFIFGSFGQMYRAVMEKRLIFNQVAFVETISAACLPIATLMLIYIGLGSLSAIVALVISAAVRSSLFMIVGRRLFRPRWRFRLNETRRFLSFGLLQTIDSLLTYVTSNITTAAIGRTVGTSGLGGFTLAYNSAVNLPARINPIMTRVMFPVFARIQADHGRIATNYVKLVAVAGLASIPLLSALALLSKDFVAVIYGEGWLWISPLISILSLVGMLRSMGNPVGSLLLATDNMRLGVAMNATKAVVTVPTVLVCAVHGGVLGAVYGLLTAQIVSFILTYVVVRRVLHIKMAAYLKATCTAVPLVIPMVMVLLASNLLLEGLDLIPLLALSIKVLLGGTALMATTFLSKNPMVVEVRRIFMGPTRSKEGK